MEALQAATRTLDRVVFLRRALEVGTHSYKARLLWEPCTYCGMCPKVGVGAKQQLKFANKRTRDHIVPVSKGGVNCWENLTPACQNCNNGKGVSSMVLWLVGQQTELQRKRVIHRDDRVRRVTAKDSGWTTWMIEEKRGKVRRRWFRRSGGYFADES